jgi:hypothetical protein
MTRKQVRELMRDIPEEDSNVGNQLDRWGIQGRYVLMVQYGPNNSVQPGAIDQLDPEEENWTVEHVALLDFAKPNPIEQFLARVGLWSRSPSPDKRCK